MLTVALPTPPAVTLAEAKSHLRVEINDEDSLITNLIAVATSMAEHELGRALVTQQLAINLDGFPRGEIALKMPPIVEIISIQYLDEDGALQTLDSTTYKLVKDSLLPCVKADTWPQGTDVEVVYRAGFGTAADVPAQIKQWILVHVASMFQNRESIGKPLESIPYVQSLLDRYVVPRV